MKKKFMNFSPPLKASIVTEFKANTINQPLYSPDLASFEFFPGPELKDTKKFLGKIYRG